MPFFQRLREARKRTGLSQTDFAALAGVGLRSQRNYEQGIRLPDVAYLERLAAAGIDVCYLLTGGRGDAPPLDADERQWLEWYRVLSPRDREAVGRMVGALAEEAGEARRLG